MTVTSVLCDCAFIPLELIKNRNVVWVYFLSILSDLTTMCLRNLDKKLCEYNNTLLLLYSSSIFQLNFFIRCCDLVSFGFVHWQGI